MNTVCLHVLIHSRWSELLILEHLLARNFKNSIIYQTKIYLKVRQKAVSTFHNN